jgi:hypothetical protein
MSPADALIRDLFEENDDLRAQVRGEAYVSIRLTLICVAVRC